MHCVKAQIHTDCSESTDWCIQSDVAKEKCQLCCPFLSCRNDYEKTIWKSSGFAFSLESLSVCSKWWLPNTLLLQLHWLPILNSNIIYIPTCLSNPQGTPLKLLWKQPKLSNTLTASSHLVIGCWWVSGNWTDYQYFACKFIITWHYEKAWCILILRKDLPNFKYVYI